MQRVTVTIATAVMAGANYGSRKEEEEVVLQRETFMVILVEGQRGPGEAGV